MAKLSSDSQRQHRPLSYPLRILLILLGWLAVLLGVLGIFLPVLPTTPFILLALWAFSLSSQRFHDYLWHHPRFGASVRNWKTHGVVPRRAKLSAVIMMGLSAALLIGLNLLPWWLLLPILLTMLSVAIWLWHRPETATQPPQEA